MALGRVVPQMSLAAVLGEEQRDGGVLVVIAASDDIRALRVDQVTGMVPDRSRGYKSNR
jgi:chemotaxis signal transduction protein